jgi:hypothetical protein
MRIRQPSLLLHPLFLISLFILLLNDFYFKNEFHNWLTGKLSDFSGLFAFNVFLIAFFPSYKKTVLLVGCLFFLWWKSPWSDALILFLNNRFSLPVHRIIDYSDYLALVVIPMAYNIKPLAYSTGFIRTIATWSVCIISFFSFTATSMIRKLADDNRVKLDKSILTKKSKDHIISSLIQEGLNPKKIPAIYEREWHSNFYVKNRDKFGDTVFVPLDSFYTELYRKIDYGNTYNIPVMYVKGDSIFNLQFAVSEGYGKRKEIWLHSFEYRMPPGISYDSLPYNQLQFSSYSIWKKLKRPIKKKFKEVIRNN